MYLLYRVPDRGGFPLAFLGSGGIDRWVVYPLIIWLPAFGGYLLAVSNDSTGEAAI
ncbi:hypothetical protein [Halobellus inordinatus]|uniref:hypothetical protein n=1 Tax=Halobellus inordinatus TaxID=1126236 RepID=UPI00211396FF|nr:hypothetical protein [Halobellus ramosii]